MEPIPSVKQEMKTVDPTPVKESPSAGSIASLSEKIPKLTLDIHASTIPAGKLSGRGDIYQPMPLHNSKPIFANNEEPATLNKSATVLFELNNGDPEIKMVSDLTEEDKAKCIDTFGPLADDEPLIKTKFYIENRNNFPVDEDKPHYFPIRNIEIVNSPKWQKFYLRMGNEKYNIGFDKPLYRVYNKQEVEGGKINDLIILLFLEKAKSLKDERLIELYETIIKKKDDIWNELPPADCQSKFRDRRQINNNWIFKYTDQDGTMRALKISPKSQACNGFLVPFLQHIGRYYTPHLTPIFETFTVNQDTYSEYTGCNKYLLYKQYRCLKMELLDGDLRRIKYKREYLVQMISLSYILNTFNIKIEDDKGRNVLYKRLDEFDTFNGKKLIDYKYWKYNVGQYCFYIPQQEYLIKRADYDEWQENAFKSFIRYGNNEIDEEEVKELAKEFQKPKGIEDEQILDLTF